MENIKISNFRKIQDSWDLDFAPITFFTGTNNSGKSTIFKAMLLLEDLVKSNNHFELDFNKTNCRKHKVDCFSNAINRSNRNNFDLNIDLKYTNRNHSINFVFKPIDITDGIISKGKLSLFILTNLENNSSLIIENTAADEYVLKLDLDSLNNSDTKKSSDDLEQQVLLETTRNLLELNQEELKNVKAIRNELAHKSRHVEMQHLENIKGVRVKTIRLNQVLRELNISLDTAVEFLDSVGIEIEKRPTAKISFEIYNELSNRFSIDKQKKSTSFNVLDLELKEQLKEFNKKIINLNKNISDNKKRLLELNRKIKNSETPKKNKTIIMPEFSLSDFHNDYLTIDSVIRNVVPKYLDEKQKKIGKIDESIEVRKVYKFGEKIRDILRFSVDHLSPHRNTQTRLYINNNMSSDINEVIREHAANPFSKSSKAGKFLKKWMEGFDIGQDFKIKQIEGAATQIEITDNGIKFNLADKGFGAGQVFTILLKIALIIDLKQDDLRTIRKRLRRRGFEEFSHTILIEEPEANLHPALQSKLADLFFNAFNECGIRFIVETHSEYMIRKSQLIVSKSSKTNPFAVYYFDKEGPYKLNYKEDGSFDKNFGEGFFDVVDDIALEIFLKNNS